MNSPRRIVFFSMECQLSRSSVRPPSFASLEYLQQTRSIGYCGVKDGTNLEIKSLLRFFSLIACDNQIDKRDDDSWSISYSQEQCHIKHTHKEQIVRISKLAAVRTDATLFMALTAS